MDPRTFLIFVASAPLSGFGLAVFFGGGRGGRDVTGEGYNSAELRRMLC